MMSRRAARGNLCGAIAAFGVIVASSGFAAAADFNEDIRPILSENCFHCHGQDPKNRMAGLRLDLAESATEDRGRGAAVVPGSSETSALYQRIVAENSAVRMPPEYSNRSLTNEQIELIRSWIDEGAPYASHWAFAAPVRPPLPKTNDPDWVREPLDAFVLARLETESLKPSDDADPATWLRRATLDLTGLPPTVEELAAFGVDAEARGEAAYESAVDRMLQSPRYGERMAMDWLDVARYADTHGFNNDASRSMWRWRDWVIDSFNSNLPYDRFVTDQLAGDLVPNPTLDQLIATGFNRNHVINSEGGIIDEEYRTEYVADRVRTVSMAWLGLSYECARCHDHKYDPITQSDYYRLFAFFNNVPEIGEDGRVANASPLISAPTGAQRDRIDALETRLESLEAKVTARVEEISWRPSMAESARKAARAAAKALPQVEGLKLDCESETAFAPRPQQPLRKAEGILGEACESTAPGGLPPLAASPPKLGDDGSVTLSLWLRANRGQDDVALVSGIDYSPDPSSTGYGKGIELRLVGSEIELRLSTRFPGYSITVRSVGAGLDAGQWRHVAAAYRGRTQAPPSRAQAAWVRMFVDGSEVRTRVLHDDLHKPVSFAETLLLGRDNDRSSKELDGRLDEVAIWSEALEGVEIARLFRARAIPYALDRLSNGATLADLPLWASRELSAASNKGLRQELAELDRARTQLFAAWRAAPTTMVMREMSPPRKTHLLARGRYDMPAEEVEPGVPEELLGRWPDEAPRNRLGLAMWLTQPSNPLTARVAVNRFWQQLFGVGLVKTSENFGFQGDWPSHPELLDWLATEFVRSGWDVKAVLRMIVLSSTYRQDSRVAPELAERDPENRLLARGPRFRLPAEAIRDQALALSGLLADRLGGPSVRPYQPKGFYDGIVVGADYPGTTWDPGSGPDLYRRSLYTFWKRTAPHPAMTVFDAPDREFCTVRRSVTNTPLQALALLNGPVFVEAARKIAERMIEEGGESVASRVRFAFRLATGRSPDAVEQEALERTFRELLASYDGETSEAKALLAVGNAPRTKVAPAAEQAAYTAVASVILNLDEVITKN